MENYNACDKILYNSLYKNKKHEQFNMIDHNVS